MTTHKKGHKTAGATNKTKNSLVKVVVKPDDAGEWVKPNTLDKFYIDDEANFPTIVFEIKTDAPGPYKWSWAMSWDAHVSGLREKARGKKVATFSDRGDFTQAGKSWDAKTINKVIGGTLTVTVEAGEEKFRRTVTVLAQQPSAEKIKAYLAARKASALEKLLAQESRFKHLILADSEPVVAGDSGYGAAQLTKPIPQYQQIWSWKENIDAAIKLIDDKKQIAKDWLSRHGTYTQDMLDTETISLWNGGHYYQWYATPAPGRWDRDKKILCDTKTGNIGWDTSAEANKDTTENDLRDRDKDEYNKMKKGQTKEHPWTYSGVCYADHILGN